MCKGSGIVALCLILAGTGSAQRSPSVTSPIHDVVQSRLIAPGSAPFHLKAEITEGGDHYANVEMYWLAPDQYRRTIDAQDFKQTLIVNGGHVFEQDSSDYFPLELRTLVTAMVDPTPILDAIRPGDMVLTKTNGGIRRMQLACLAPGGLCATGNGGLREVVQASGHSVSFADYQTFKGKPVARLLTNAPRLGEDLTSLHVKKLEELRSTDPDILRVTDETSAAAQLRVVDEPESTLRGNLSGGQEIIWPQPLDGQQKGTASFYVSIDRKGNVREIKQLYTVNERTNDPAISQLMRWKFKPFAQDGSPVQAEGILTFAVDTRAWGPAEPLNNEEARKLATGIVEPSIVPGTFPSGTVYTLWAAVDSEGKLIEVMAGSGPGGLFSPCYDALRKWQFHPIMENGQPRPYRAQIAFRVP